MGKEMDRRTVEHEPESLQVPVGVFQQHPTLLPHVVEVAKEEHWNELEEKIELLQYRGTSSSILASFRSRLPAASGSA